MTHRVATTTETAAQMRRELKQKFPTAGIRVHKLSAGAISINWPPENLSRDEVEGVADKYRLVRGRWGHTIDGVQYCSEYIFYQQYA